MSFPTLKVEIAFVSNPLDTAPTWVDVSQYVRDTPGVRVRRGGNGEPDQPDSAGRCSFTLSNRDRRFDPTYAAGPYFGNLRARKQVRVTATWAAVDYPVFAGFVTGFPVSGAEMGTDSVVEVECYDALGYLAGDRLSGDPLADYVASLGGAYMWLRQADPAFWDDSTDLHQPSMYGAPSTTATMIPGSSSTAVNLGTSHLLEMQGVDPSGTPAPAALPTFTCAFWMSATTSTGVRLRIIFEQSDSFNVTAMGIYVDPATGGIYHAWQDAAGPITYMNGTTRVDDGLPHYVVLTSTGNLYVDGILDVSGTAKFRPGGIGWSTAVLSAEDSTGLKIQDFLVLTVAASAAQVLAMYGLGRGEVPESTATRVGRYLNDVSWPATWRNIATDTRGIVGELVYNGQQVLTALQQVERSEQGRVFAAKNGYLTFTGRYTYAEVTRSKTVQATLSDDGADQGYKTLRYDTGVDDIANDITVRNNLNSSRATNTTSKTTYGTTADTVDTNLSSLAQCRDMAGGLVYQRKDPAVRFDPLTIMPSNWPTTLGLESGDRIQIESTPMAVGAQTVQVVLIESIEWSISLASGWYFTVAGRPVPANAFWLLGTSVLGTSTFPGF